MIHLPLTVVSRLADVGGEANVSKWRPPFTAHCDRGWAVMGRGEAGWRRSLVNFPTPGQGRLRLLLLLLAAEVRWAL